MNSTKRDKALVTINVVIWVFLVTAAVISFSHIVESSTRLGLDYERWLSPIFVDGLAIVGKVSMIERFPAAFRRSGRRLLMLGGTLSLAANVYAGHNAGQRGFGVLVVGGFMLLEHHAGKAASAVGELARKARQGTPWSVQRRQAFNARKAAAAVPPPAPVPAPAPIVTVPVHPVQVASRPRVRRAGASLGHAAVSPLTGISLVPSNN